MTKRCKLAVAFVLLATSVGIVVSALLLPPATPAIAVAGFAVAGLVAGEVIKMAAVRAFGSCMNRQNSSQESDSSGSDTDDSSYHSVQSTPARPNTPDIDRPDSALSGRTEDSTATPIIYRFRRYRASESITEDVTVAEESYHSGEINAELHILNL